MCIRDSDYTQVSPNLDFVTREDGTASDPNNLFPIEIIYAALTAMSFGTVGFAFVLAYVPSSSITMKGAASLSLFFHAIWFFHMNWKWDTWRAFMHPDG